MTRQLQAGKPALLVPRRSAIWTFGAASCPFPNWFDALYFESAPLTLKLALCLLYERSLGSKSKVRLRCHCSLSHGFAATVAAAPQESRQCTMY